MTLLSTVVTAVGLMRDNVAVIVGAMVIAPLLGPNMALCLGATLGDLGLLKRARGGERNFGRSPHVIL